MMSNKDYLKFVREDIKALSAYKVQEADNLVKLDAMENPFELPDIIRQDWLEKLSSLAVNRYPDPKAIKLKEKLSRFLGLGKDHDILFGNGSDELIQILMMALAKANASVMSVEPSFVMYRMIARFCGVNYIGIDLKEDFSLDLDALKAAIISEAPALFFLAQPNNPTGNLFSPDEIEQLIALSEGWVVIDEAYTAFADYDGQYLLDKFENVLILRTFSKAGLAGARLGYLLGRTEMLAELDKVRMPYNINSPTQALMESVLDHYQALQEQSKALIILRKTLAESLISLENVKVYASEANFILITLLAHDARTVAEQLRQRGVLIKVFDGAHPLLANCLRITVGSEEENRILLATLKQSLAPYPGNL